MTTTQQATKETKDNLAAIASAIDDLPAIHSEVLAHASAVRKSRTSGDVRRTATRAVETQMELSEKLAKISSLISGTKRSLQIILDKKRSKAKGGAQISLSQSELINSLDASLPTWPVARITPLCGCLPLPRSQSLVIGLEVAARVDGNWILSVLTRMKERDDRYWVADILRSPSTEADTLHIVSRDEIIPLPRWTPLHDFKEALFNAGDRVLALYPRTTCFYEASVHKPPSKHSMKYTLSFSDDSYSDGRVRFLEVPVKYVLNAPEEFFTWS